MMKSSPFLCQSACASRSTRVMAGAIMLARRLQVTARAKAHGDRGGKEAEREAGAEKARQAPIERHGDRASRPHARARQKTEEAIRKGGGRFGVRGRPSARAAGRAG